MNISWYQTTFIFVYCCLIMYCILSPSAPSSFQGPPTRAPTPHFCTKSENVFSCSDNGTGQCLQPSSLHPRNDNEMKYPWEAEYIKGPAAEAVKHVRFNVHFLDNHFYNGLFAFAPDSFSKRDEGWLFCYHLWRTPRSSR